MLLTTALTCLAINIYHEARSEPLVGQHAVAQVTMNRAGWNKDRVCEVVLKPAQFSWTKTLVRKTPQGYRLKRHGKPQEDQAWETAVQIARATMRGETSDVIAGATYYHANYVAPKWANSMQKVAVIGEHIFYRHPTKSQVRYEHEQTPEAIRPYGGFTLAQLAGFFISGFHWSEFAPGRFA